MKTLKNNSVKANEVKATKNATVKANKVNKPYVMPKSVKAKINANNVWKQETRSISALFKYINSKEAEKSIRTYLDSIGANEYAIKSFTKKALLENMSDKEKTNKDGSKKELFSVWVFLQAMARISKARNKANKS